MYTTYLTCPQQALARLRGEFRPDTRLSFKGNLAHRVFARHLRDGPISGDGFALACKEEMGKGMNAKLGAVGLKPSELSGVIAEVGQLYERFKRLAHPGFADAEVFLEVEPLPGLVLRGSVDAVFDDAVFDDGGSDDEGSVRLVDWKTGALGGAQDQLAFYALLWSLAHGRLPMRVEAVSVATGERYAEVPTEATAHATASAVASLAGALREAFAGDHDVARVAGGWCRWCPVLDTCDEGSSAAAVFGDARRG